MTLRCAVLDDYQGAATTFADWSSIADEVELTVYSEHRDDEDELAAALLGYDIAVVMRERTPFPSSLLARLPRLRLLVTSGMRNAAIDLAAARAHGVVVCGTSSHPEPPAELTWALILGLARNLTTENAALRAAGPWQSTVGTDLHGAQLGLLGFGKIGTRVAAVGHAFGMQVVAWSPNLTAERTDAFGVRLAPSKAALMATSDVVSIHLVLGGRSRGAVGAAELAVMKPSAYLVNTSRAAVVDGPALVAALRERRIAGAGLDVFEVEPLPAGDELRTLPNVLATPHLGYVTRRNYRAYFGQAVEDIAAFIAGSPTRVLS